MIGRKIPRKKAPRSSSDSGKKKTKCGRKKIKPRVPALPNATGADPAKPSMPPSVMNDCALAPGGSGSRLQVACNLKGAGGLVFDIYALPTEDAVPLDDLLVEDAHLYGDEEYDIDGIDGVECVFYY